MHFASDADNVRYEVGQNQIYVGYGEGALGVLDAASRKRLGDIALPAHPESFRLEESGQRIFVNLPNANHTIAVVDRAKRSVIATWALEQQANFPMALDEADHRPFGSDAQAAAPGSAEHGIWQASGGLSRRG